MDFLFSPAEPDVEALDFKRFFGSFLNIFKIHRKDVIKYIVRRCGDHRINNYVALFTSTVVEKVMI